MSKKAKKKILLLSDDIRIPSGVGTMSQNLAFSFMAQANGSGDYFNIYCHHYAGSTREVDKNALLTWWNGFKLIGLS